MPYKDKATEKAAKRAHYDKNKERIRAYHRAYYAKQKQTIIRRVADWRRANPGAKAAHHRAERYNLSRSAYLALVERQGGKCAICDRVPEGPSNMATLRVDHCHATGVVRALLCHKCNAGLGMFLDTPALVFKAAMYLAAHEATSVTA